MTIPGSPQTLPSTFQPSFQPSFQQPVTVPPPVVEEQPEQAEEPERPDSTPDAPDAMPHWRALEAPLLALDDGEVLTYERIGEIMGVAPDFLSHHNIGNKVRYRARRATQELPESHGRVFRFVRGQGVQRATVNGVIAQAQGHQARAIKEIQTGAVKIRTVDVTGLTGEHAALVRATADSLGQQQSFMLGRDVRQKRLSNVLALASAPPPYTPGMPVAVTDPPPVALPTVEREYVPGMAVAPPPAAEVVPPAAPAALPVSGQGVRYQQDQGFAAV